MPTVTIASDGVCIRLSRREKLAGLLRDLHVPASQVRDARAVTDGLAEVSGFRAPGLHLPGSHKYGTWRRREGKTYAAVRRGEPALVLDLQGHRYASVVVTAADAERLARQLVLR